jgi:hypothetical protein
MSNPSSITNCTFWIDPTFTSGYTIANGTVSSISRLNSRMNSNQYYITQNSRYPFITSNSVLNNNTAMYWDGTGYGIMGGTNFGWSNGSSSGHTLAAVFHSVSTSTQRQIFARAGSASFAFGTDSNGSAFGVNDNANGGFNKPYVNGLSNTVILIAVYENSNTSLYANNIQQSTITQVPNNYNYWDVGDATSYGIPGTYTGYIGDIITYDKPLTSSERIGLYKYLVRKWAFSFNPANVPSPYRQPLVLPSFLQFWWTPPPVTEAEDIITYRVTDGTISSFTQPSQLTATFSDLTPGTSYSFGVSYSTTAGYSQTSYFRPVSTCSQPDPPTNPSYTSVGGDGYVLSWSNPTFTGNGALLGTCLSFIPSTGPVSKLSALGSDTTERFLYLPQGSSFTVAFQSVNDCCYSVPTYLSTITT